MDERCIFCKIAAGEIPAETIYEDELVRVILDLAPGARGHALVLPKTHYPDATAMPEALLGHVMWIGARVGEAQMKAYGYTGFNLIQNNGEAAGQTVFHFHLHVIPRQPQDGVLGLWQPGTSNPAELAAAGEALREAFPVLA